jgi:histone-arginine methyltransferase CARM1
MLADYARTSAYQDAFFNNTIDFSNKIVLDVGTGTGILAFFAIQSGAAFVFAVDASDSIEIASKLANANGMNEKIKFIKGKIEEITLPVKVDIIVSEPIGFLLVHERMLESYIFARDKFLKHDGLMMPSLGSIFVAPISDEPIWKEQLTKAEFWKNSNFYGVDLSAVIDLAMDEYFSQPIVGLI